MRSIRNPQIVRQLQRSLDGGSRWSRSTTRQARWLHRRRCGTISGATWDAGTQFSQIGCCALFELRAGAIACEKTRATRDGGCVDQNLHATHERQAAVATSVDEIFHGLSVTRPHALNRMTDSNTRKANIAKWYLPFGRGGEDFAEVYGSRTP
jgi:hypothetical protein